MRQGTVELFAPRIFYDPLVINGATIVPGGQSIGESASAVFQEAGGLTRDR